MYSQPNDTNGLSPLVIEIGKDFITVKSTESKQISNHKPTELNINNFNLLTPPTYDIWKQKASELPDRIVFRTLILSDDLTQESVDLIWKLYPLNPKFNYKITIRISKSNSISNQKISITDISRIIILNARIHPITKLENDNDQIIVHIAKRRK